MWVASSRMDGSGATVGLAEALETALEPELGPVAVEELRRLSGGASRETWSFVAAPSGGGDVHRLVLQRTRGGLRDGMRGPSMATEDVLLQAARDHGVPVPPVVVPSARAGGLGEARVTRHVDGETLGRRIVRDERYAPAREVLVGQCAAALAALHRVDPASVPGLEVLEPLRRLRAGLDLLGESRPAFELALRWLHDHRPPEGRLRVVHGDFRLGNLIVDGSGLRAVLDWELAHLGDPVEDLGWLCVRAWRFGGDGVAAGIGTARELLDAYEAAGGERVDPARLHWWIVAGTLTWGLICSVQARRHLDGHVRSVELATIGRRVVETEYDLLQLLGVPPTFPAPGETAAPRRLLEERPTATELLDAVRAHLDEEVAPELEGAAAFHLRVASNALAIVAREVRYGPEADRQARARLRALGIHGGERELAARLRDDDLTPSPEVLAAVRASVVDRLRIANPRWLEPPDTPEG